MLFMIFYVMPTDTLTHTVRSMRAQAMPASRSAVRTSTERQLGPSVTTTAMGVKALHWNDALNSYPGTRRCTRGAPSEQCTTHRTLAARPCSELICRHGLEDICDVHVHEKVLQGVAG